MTVEASVNRLLVQDDSSTYFDSGFRTVLEDHMTYLRTHADTVAIAVTPMQAYKYEFDMTGLLLELLIPVKMHWTIVRMNHLTSLTQVPADLTQLLIPPEQQLSRIKQAYESAKKVSIAK